MKDQLHVPTPLTQMKRSLVTFGQDAEGGAESQSGNRGTGNSMTNAVGKILCQMQSS